MAEGLRLVYPETVAAPRVPSAVNVMESPSNQ
jgi:hypothetical protein